MSETHRRLVDILAPLDGAKVPGGCETCDAYQTVFAVTAGVWAVRIYHDDDCPGIAAAEEELERRTGQLGHIDEWWNADRWIER